MFEAYARNKYTSTGVIQWMLNNAWPSMIWHLYDYYLRPGGGYYGTKKACEPLHVQYSYDDRSVVVVNDLQQAFKGLKVSAEVLDLDLTSQVLGRGHASTWPPTASRGPSWCRSPKDLTTTYFLRLGLEDAGGQAASARTSTGSRHARTCSTGRRPSGTTRPRRSHADLTALAQPARRRRSRSRRGFERRRARRAPRVVSRREHRQGAGLPGAPEAASIPQSGEELLPVFWDDNYFALFPGEKRERARVVSARRPAPPARSSRPRPGTSTEGSEGK